MNGQLRDHPLAELIHEISGARLSGALRLAHERLKGAVYFDGGEIIAALTNLRAQRLSEVLRRAKGEAVAARLEELNGAGMGEDKACAALVEAGEVSAAELEGFRARQSAEGLKELLGWAEGTWGFDPRVRLTGNYRAALDMPQLLLEGARSLPAEFVAGRMGDEEELLSPAAEALGGAVEGLQLLPTEAFVFSRASEPMRLGELIAASGLPEAETRRALYALALGGLVRRERWPQAFSPEMLIRARATPKGEPRDESSAAASSPSPTANAPEEAAPEPAAEPAAPAAEKTPREEMEELFERARAATHYAVLGLTRSAAPAEVKSVYYSLARRFHPDRFRRDSDERLQQQLDNSFARVTQAYEVLKDASLRAAYDLKLGKETEGGQTGTSGEAAESKTDAARPPAPESPPPSPSSSSSQESALLYRAEEKYQQGVAALQQNNTTLATRLLGEAALLVPKQARYRALYGRALSREKRTRRQAEAELLAAIGLDEKNPSYRVMLAELYLEIGLRRRAEGELERALAFDPSHAAARRLLRELRPAK